MGVVASSLTGSTARAGGVVDSADALRLDQIAFRQADRGAGRIDGLRRSAGQDRVGANVGNGFGQAGASRRIAEKLEGSLGERRVGEEPVGGEASGGEDCDARSREKFSLHGDALSGDGD